MATRVTKQGDAIRQALRAQNGFRSAQQMHAALRDAGSTVGLSTVYRHLQALADTDEVDAIQGPDGETAYRYCGDANRSHHHHLVCRDCGRTEELEARAVERWAASMGDTYGYRDVEHTVELFGTCAACARRAFRRPRR